MKEKSSKVSKEEIPIVPKEELKAPKEAKKPKEQFDEGFNAKLLKNIREISKEKQLKFSNPIRDYSHLLSNRLVHLLVQLSDLNQKGSLLLNGSEKPTSK